VNRFRCPRWPVLLVLVSACAFAACSSASPDQAATSSGSKAGPDISTKVVSVSSTSQLGDMVMWTATNKTEQPQLATCEVLVLNGSTQLGELGPLQVVVAAGATAEQYSQVTTLAGSEPHDTAQIVCQRVG
jgi:hypothetical protein